jgi:hypothetical protein
MNFLASILSSSSFYDFSFSYGSVFKEDIKNTRKNIVIAGKLPYTQDMRESN